MIILFKKFDKDEVYINLEIFMEMINSIPYF